MGEGEEGATCQSPIHHGLCLALAATVAPESPPKRFAGKKTGAASHGDALLNAWPSGFYRG